MAKAKTALIKYIFLDIVGFTKERSVEAQSDLISYLNYVVTEALKNNNLNDDQDILPRGNDHTILIPTGDGICIALVDIRNPYDIHLQIALDILNLVHEHNSKTEDEMRRFEIRVGLNENVDNLVTDINGNQNVAGMGINMAQRAMNQADGGQILVGQTTYETLCGREKYMKSFRRYQAQGKHGVQFPVYQYIDRNKNGLNVEAPQVFAPAPKKRTPKLSKLLAYYLAHAIKNKDFLFSVKEQPEFDSTAVILLYFLAKDSHDESERDEYQTRWRLITWRSGITTIEEQYEHYKEMDLGVNMEFETCLEKIYLKEIADCFEGPSYLKKYAFVNDKGRERLKNEWPEIWEELSPDQFL